MARLKRRSTRREDWKTIGVTVLKADKRRFEMLADRLGYGEAPLGRAILLPYLAAIDAAIATLGEDSVIAFIRARGITAAVEMLRHPDVLTPTYFERRFPAVATSLPTPPRRPPA